MSTQKKSLLKGSVMLVIFSVVLVGFFLPLFGGKNGLDTLDNLYNCISKASANYIPGVMENSKAFNGTEIQVSLSLANEKSALQAAQMMQIAGAKAQSDGKKVKVQGDFGAILQSCLTDAGAMYDNDGGKVSARYGFNERQAMHLWWNMLRGLNKDLTAQKKFKEAKFAHSTNQKAVEMAYNYYGVQAQRIADRWGVVVLSLVFYVCYTMWYGFGILYCFEGLGLKIGH